MTKEVEKSVSCVEFALRRLEDVWNVEASLLSGVTSLSEAGDLMVLVKPMLEKIQLVLVDTASTPAPCWENSDDDQQSAGAGVMKWITEVVDVCICIDTVVLKFSIKAGETIQRLPEAVKRISTEPIDLFHLNWLAIEMKKIQSQLDSIINDNAFRQPDATLQAFPQRARPSPQMELVGYEALQKSIIDKLRDPTPERLEVAILGPEAAGKTAFLEKIY